MSWLSKLKKTKPYAKQRESLLRVRHEIEKMEFSQTNKREIEAIFQKKTA